MNLHPDLSENVGHGSSIFPWRCSLDVMGEQPPETQWLIEGIIPAGAVVLLSGREGSMKTWLALDWAHAAAKGEDSEAVARAKQALAYLRKEVLPHYSSPPSR